MEANAKLPTYKQREMSWVATYKTKKGVPDVNVNVNEFVNPCQRVKFFMNLKKNLNICKCKFKSL